jgi:hypothetical protein
VATAEMQISEWKITKKKHQVWVVCQSVSHCYDKIPEKKSSGRKDLFWFMVSKVSALCWQAPLIWASSEAEYYCRRVY